MFKRPYVYYNKNDDLVLGYRDKNTGILMPHLKIYSNYNIFKIKNILKEIAYDFFGTKS